MKLDPTGKILVHSSKGIPTRNISDTVYLTEKSFHKHGANAIFLGSRSSLEEALRISLLRSREIY